MLVTKEDFVDWIMAQDDSKPVNMSEINGDCQCGCVMVQYAKEVLHMEPSKIFCALSLFEEIKMDSTHNRLNTSILEIIKGHWSEINNFGDLKKRLV